MPYSSYCYAARAVALACVVAFGSTSIAPLSVRAQSEHVTSSVSAPNLAPADSAAPESYTHYPIRRCAAAIDRHARAAREELDTTVWTPNKAIGSDEIRAVAKRCREVGGWTAATVDPRELFPLLHVDAVLGDTADGNAVIKRSLSLARTPDEQVARLLKLHDLQLSYAPVNWSWANESLVRLKAIPGRKAANALGDAYANMLLIAGMYHAFDYPTILAYLDSVAKIVPAMDSAHRQNAAALTRLMHAMHWADVDSIMVNGAPLTVPRVNGQVILGVPGPYPVPNKITVFVALQGSSNVPPAIAARRLVAKFSDTVAVVFVRKSQGYYNWLPQLKFADEARLLRTHYTDSLHAPGTVILEETPIHFRPAPDGRRVYEPTPNDTLYKPLYPPEFANIDPPFPGFSWMVVNSSGHLQNAGMGFGDYTALQIERSVERAIRRTKSAQKTIQ